MRLIDADEMWANGFENKTVKIDRAYLEPTCELQIRLMFGDAQRFIDRQPTVEAVLVEQLNKAKEEITYFRDRWEKECHLGEANALTTALRIIDKYTKGEDE